MACGVFDISIHSVVDVVAVATVVIRARGSSSQSLAPLHLPVPMPLLSPSHFFLSTPFLPSHFFLLLSVTPLPGDSLTGNLHPPFPLPDPKRPTPVVLSRPGHTHGPSPKGVDCRLIATRERGRGGLGRGLCRCWCREALGRGWVAARCVALWVARVVRCAPRCVVDR